MSDLIHTIVAGNVHRVRKLRRITLKNLAAMVIPPLSENMVHKYEKYEKYGTCIPPHYIFQFATALDVSVLEMFRRPVGMDGSSWLEALEKENNEATEKALQLLWEEKYYEGGGDV